MTRLATARDHLETAEGLTATLDAAHDAFENMLEDMMPNGSVQPDPSPDAGSVHVPVERTLRDLGITHPGMLGRSAEIDRSSARLIIDAATELSAGQRQPVATVLSQSAGSAEVINHALASGDPRAAAGILRVVTVLLA